ncbi:nucleotidyl transferase AbiEii/AbiGii toxin family protein [Streptomyces sp. BR123]|uniref:nucleotidyl transferase AbiEii/AbiGii toxin family protein n=1 Tax=Streptomyces sp. BR123 TaxID=2749828 RepID=UPI0015C46EA4|nr:nucleotidyl transferase AbiEii/AbiGii toxin family protein [Streptomyces sp. BR123]NXY99528.1 nucleotidyl transferase AbiEii/AbiGii toxin family protein [Streptomyces sp. BR123]
MSGAQWSPSIPGGPDDPAEPAEERLRRADSPPRTLLAGAGPQAPSAVAFDPALKHFAGAYRLLDPAIEDPVVREAWLRARRTAMAVALRAVRESGWAPSLVLRGSMLMARWFGPSAREPHDLDFVVVPADRRIEEDRTGRMLDDIAAAAERLAGDLDMPAREAASEYIWTYERVPGRRLVLPWSAPGLPGGQVQLDFVFNEPLPVPAEPVEVAGVPLLGATRELSLAWKLMWLAGDLYPQGKDLYDAVLLAESRTPSRALVEEVFRLSGEFEEQGRTVPFTPDVFESFAHVDWSGFRREYPALDVEESGLVRRLLAALEPVFAQDGP